MGLDERLGWIALGCVLGFILGYIVRSLRDIEEVVHDMDDIVREQNEKPKRKRNGEKGLVRKPLLLDFALLLVVCLTVWASFQTAAVNEQLNRTLDCLTKHNTKQGTALKGRDRAITEGTESEIKLWARYGKLYKIAKSDPSKIPVLQEKLNKSIKAHKNDLIRLQKTRENLPYAKPDINEECEDVK